MCGVWQTRNAQKNAIGRTRMKVKLPESLHYTLAVFVYQVLLHLDVVLVIGAVVVVVIVLLVVRG